MSKATVFDVFIIATAILLPVMVLADVGVGVALGKIRVEHPLKPGMVYEVAELPVLNTGNEAGDYEVTIQYHRDQPELPPPAEWFSFTPQHFSLEPAGVQKVRVVISLPLKGVKPGDYFAFLQARPVVEKTVAGGVSISIAAASKLWFTVAPANFWQAVYYRVSYKVAAFWAWATPWIWFVIVLICGAIIVLILKRFFHFQIPLRKK